LKDINRIIGDYTSNIKGPLLFITGGIHGNEISGIRALENVFKILKKNKVEIEGTVVGVAGNKAALKNNVRFIDEDLNRTWTKKNIASHEVDSHEKKEMFEIIDVLKTYQEKEYTKCYFLDCHTTSSASEPYISVQEINDNDAWAHLFPTYIIRGFSDIVLGCIDHYESRIGMTGFVFEGGQHTSIDAVENHEGMIWLAIQNACNLNLNELTDYPEAARMLSEKRKHRKTFEIKYRHGLKETDSFKMKPGFKNFQRLKKGDVLAHQNGKEVVSEWNDYIFMPLYQSQGNDGFFVVEEVGEAF
jgi:succinylglutamate desuccinylase